MTELLDPNVKGNTDVGENKEALPNGIAILVLGILSIQLSFAWGITGLICSLITLSKWKSRNQLYLEDPDRYANWSYRCAKIGNTCAIVGVILSSIITLVMLFLLVAVAN